MICNHDIIEQKGFLMSEQCINNTRFYVVRSRFPNINQGHLSCVLTQYIYR